MKSLLLILLIPLTLNAVCKDCYFPYQRYLRKYQSDYEKMALYYSMTLVEIDDLTTEREMAIFYSGGAFCIQQIRESESKY